MRTTGRRSFVLYILLGICFAAAIWLFINYFISGRKWAMQNYNGHLSTSALGEITDRQGALLAETENDERIYNANEEIRKAMLHTVGDSGNNITTSVQATMRAKLSGYNPITGAGNTVFNKIGNNIELTVSANVSLEAYLAMEGRKGAVIVYNYETGEVITKVSTPTYDPANPPENLLSDESGAYDGMLLDNTLASSFVPGSIFKLVTQAAAMDRWTDWAQKEYTCNGSVNIGGADITCLGTHGVQNAQSALGNSCNVYYALLANDLGKEDLQKKAEEFGFNKNQKFDNVTVKASSIDLKDADSSALGWAGVGQYTLLANPYHMMTLMGAIAGGGSYAEPKLTNGMDLLGSINSGGKRYMDVVQASALKELMRKNVIDYYGEGIFPAGMQVCAKTGTGEVGGGKLPTCWMVGFCDSSSAPYAFAVVVEEGSGGLDTAGAVAARVLRAIYENI